MCLHDSLFQCGFEYGGGNPAHRNPAAKGGRDSRQPVANKISFSSGRVNEFSLSYDLVFPSGYGR